MKIIITVILAVGLSIAILAISEYGQTQDVIPSKPRMETTTQTQDVIPSKPRMETTTQTQDVIPSKPRMETTTTESTHYTDAVKIIGTSTPQQVPGMGLGGTRLFYAGRNEKMEVFGIQGHPGVSVGSTLRVGIGHEPTVATLSVEGSPDLTPEVVYIGIDKKVLEDIQTYDSVEVRIEVHTPGGGFLNNNALMFTPGYTKPANPPRLRKWDDETGWIEYQENVPF